jgi:hypothetical protein
MKITRLLPILLILATLAPGRSTPGDQWELEMDRDGIRVYTQVDETSPYKQVKVTATINAPMEKVKEILLAFSNYKTWMNHVDESYLLNQLDSAYYVFILEDATWPMQNRYQVSRMLVSQTRTNCKLHFRAMPNYIEKRQDAIQIKQYEGYWSLTDQPDHRCSIEYVLVHHPGGHVPPWLANLHAAQNPYQSVSRLKTIAEQQSIRP